MPKAEKYWQDMADDLEAKPFATFFWPLKRGEIDFVVEAMRQSRPEWQRLPSRFKQAFYRRWRQYNIWQLEKARAEKVGDDPQDHLRACTAPQPFEKPAPDDPAVTS